MTWRCGPVRARVRARMCVSSSARRWLRFALHVVARTTKPQCVCFPCLSFVSQDLPFSYRFAVLVAGSEQYLTSGFQASNAHRGFTLPPGNSITAVVYVRARCRCLVLQRSASTRLGAANVRPPRTDTVGSLWSSFAASFCCHGCVRSWQIRARLARRRGAHDPLCQSRERHCGECGASAGGAVGRCVRRQLGGASAGGPHPGRHRWVSGRHR